MDALGSYLEDVVTDWGLTHTLTDDLAAAPPRETAITIFRICQEALTNVRKHARAASVAISLRSVDGGVLTRVADDGVGIDPGTVPIPGTDHYGLVEMRERAETAGGWWTTSGAPGQGTTVAFWLPVPPTADPEPTR